MGTEITIRTHEGELHCDDECIHTPSYTTYEDYGDTEVWYEVDAHILQESTSTILRTIKEFEDKVSAKKFASLFVTENPISEVIIREKTSKEVFYYV